MRKKTIVILFLLSVLITVGTIVIAVATGALASASYQSCYNTYNSCSGYSSGTTTALSFGFLFVALLDVIASVLGLIAWIGALVKQGKQEQWGWFVCTLIFGGICLLIYLIAVPETPQYNFTGYMPGYQPLQPPMYQPPTQYPSPYQQPQPYQPYQPPTDDSWRPY